MDDFSVSVMLRDSDMVMYDRNTESLWQQITDEAAHIFLEATYRSKCVLEHILCVNRASTGLMRGCVKNVLRHDAVSKRKGSSSEPAWRSRLPTAVSCWSRKAAGRERHGKGAARLHPVRVKETSASKLRRRHRNRFNGIQTGALPLSGRSMAVTYLLARRCPVVQAA
jgi:hypothetical protein